jgi:hypothetical protein
MLQWLQTQDRFVQVVLPFLQMITMTAFKDAIKDAIHFNTLPWLGITLQHHLP